MTQEDMKHRSKLEYSEELILEALATLAQRMAQHRRDMRYKERQHWKIFKAMNEIGRDALFIGLLEDYPCQKREELLRKEGEKMREHQSELSKIISGRSKKQYRQENSQQTQEKQSELYERNRPQLIQYQKNYRNNNREMLKLKKK